MAFGDGKNIAITVGELSALEQSTKRFVDGLTVIKEGLDAPIWDEITPTQFMELKINYAQTQVENLRAGKEAQTLDEFLDVEEETEE